MEKKGTCKVVVKIKNFYLNDFFFELLRFQTCIGYFRLSRFNERLCQPDCYRH
jgi:hypothetical protein